ncbi:family 78 glycoside hydrolase catalytic domain [Mucilaginibacter ximonensis]|uniref:alpha-L-rhamnosidase n=1 Tax=Mucilaginibacter ximonensis TaxID=538021 RepID=A0ABW5Y805_9SPHI
MMFLKNSGIIGVCLFLMITGTVKTDAKAFTTDVKIQNLKCAYLSNPIAIDERYPVLSWQLTSSQLAKSQTAYHVLVASSRALLAQNKGDYWNSGRVASANSTQVVYKGEALASRQRVYWKVMIWDEKNQPSAWSATGSWQMGLLAATDWKARWIGETVDQAANKAVTYPAPYFRKEFVSQKKILKATAYVSGLGFYELYINGKKIGTQVLAPAITNYDVRPLKKLLYPYDDQSTQRVLYNTFDVTQNIAPNKNAIGIVLGNGWYNQRDRTVEGTMWYDTPKLIFQLEIAYTDGSKQIITSDKSWKTTTGPLLHDGIFSGETYDAWLNLANWNQRGYNDAAWQPAITVRPPTGGLHPQTAPFDKVLRILKPNFDGRINDSVYQYHINETVAGWAAIKVKGAAGSRVKIRYISEEGNDYGQFDTYILKGGSTESWEPKFTWHAFRRMEIISKDVQLDAGSVVVKDVHTDVDHNGTFECSNPLFNKINEAYLRTLRANLHGSLSSDCPHRERLGYTGDGQVAMESALLSFELPQFYRKWFDDMGDARNHKTGFVTHTAPFAGGGGGPAWGSAYVIMPWLYYTYYGDAGILAQHYTGMKQWVSYLQTRTDDRGLITHEEPKGWCLGDWCTPDRIQLPEPLVNTAYFYNVTTTMAKVAARLGKTADRKQFETLAQQIKTDFNQAYYHADKNTYWEGRQGADVLALAFDLVPDNDREAVFNSLLDHLAKLNYHFDTGILGTPLLLKVLSANNRDDIAFKIMNQKDSPGFGYLLDSKNSTLWEQWDGGGSHTHPMFGSVVQWFYSALGGIKPEAAGMQHFTIAPKPVGDVSYCKASYNSLFGKIRSEWKKATNGDLDVLIEIPANTSASFVLPDGENVIKDDKGKSIATTKINGQYVAQFKSGIYRFQVL